MANVTEHLIKDSDNVITVTVLEDNSPLAGSWVNLEINIGNGTVVITRTTDENGVGFLNGVLTINTSELTENLDALIEGNLYPVVIQVKDSGSTDGYHYGALDSADRLWFEIGTT